MQLLNKIVIVFLVRLVVGSLLIFCSFGAIDQSSSNIDVFLYGVSIIAGLFIIASAPGTLNPRTDDSSKVQK